MYFSYDGQWIGAVHVASLQQVIELDQLDPGSQYARQILYQLVDRTIDAWALQTQAALFHLIERITNALVLSVSIRSAKSKEQGRMILVNGDGHSFTVFVNDFFRAEDPVTRTLRLLCYFQPNYQQMVV